MIERRSIPSDGKVPKIPYNIYSRYLPYLILAKVLCNN